MLKRIASSLPDRYQQALKRYRFGRQIRRGKFLTVEEEFGMLDAWVSEGDCVLDVGANIGHYTLRLASLVGDSGRVFAFEPVPETFELLAANMMKAPFRNITLINAAVSDGTSSLGMSVPKWPNKLKNYYQAEVVDAGSDLTVMSFAVDSLGIQSPVAFVKIDVEGHELAALMGMENLLRRNRPVLVVEGEADDVAQFLNGLGYSYDKLPGSPNRIYRTDKEG